MRRARRRGASSLGGLALLFAAGLALNRCAASRRDERARPALAPPASVPASPRDVSAPNASPAAPVPPASRGGALAAVAASPNVALGVPTDADPSDDVLIDERAYVVSYNPRRRVANWVSWRLDRASFGSVGRRDDFRPDPALPPELYRVTPHDYAKSGYDRGHLCPSGDRQSSPEENSLTFLMTNMHPQLHELNAGPWEKLEQWERQLARRPGAEVHVVAGPVFAEPSRTIGNGVAVPKASFKIVVELGAGEGPSAVRNETRVVAVSMPNEHGVGGRAWTDFATSVDALEAATGYDFLSAVPVEVQAAIEARVAAPR